MIQLQGVNKVYELGGEKIYALDNVSLEIAPGEFVAVMGPSGSGKSTLANVIGGLDSPDSGQITVGDQEITKIRDKALSTYRNKKVGFVFQTFNLHSGYTALENVMIPLVFAGVRLGKRKKKAQACLQAVGLGDRMKHKPGQLSGGQRQRVSIARALANDPEIIIADEPTGNLDTKKGREIIDLLKKLNVEQGVILIAITHDSEIARQAGRIINIKDGRVS
ncbi:MAG: ABC transporter ATP-binding protein [Parcubacteria group bacterium]|nr:ABC transporter ATP-binding protein [Parcubacteria group bacterium]